jgi:hypothetical protein
MKWQELRKWRRKGKDFLIEVTHYDESIWNIHLYLYPDHPLFKADRRAFDQAPGHCYISLFQRNRLNSDTDTSLQVGWDYNHEGDDYYRDLRDPGPILADADKLYDWVIK